MQENKIKFTSFKEIVDDLIEGIKGAYKNCPKSDKNCPNYENKTFEEGAHWAGQHILLTEEKE